MATEALLANNWNGDRAVGAIKAALEDKSTTSRTQYAILGMISDRRLAGPNVATVLPSLVKLLDDDNLFLRTAALQRIYGGRWEEKALIDAMAPILADKNAKPRTLRIVIKYMGDRGINAKEIVSLLIPLLQNKDTWIRVYAAKMLGNAEEAADAAIPALIQALDDDSLSVRHSAADALVEIGPAAVNAIRKTLHNHDPNVRALVAKTLGRFKSEAAAAVPDLAVLLANDESLAVRGNAAQSIGQIGDTTGAVVPDLVKALQHNSGYVRGNAALALGKIKPYEVAALKKALNDNDAFVRRNSAEALALIGSDAKDAESELAAAVADDDPVVREHAAQALRQITLSDSSILYLVNNLSDSDPVVRQYTVELLVEVASGSKAEAIIPSLSRLVIKDGAPEVQQAAAKALGQIGTASAIVMAALSDGLQNPRPGVRREAAVAMGKLKPVPKEFVDGLTQRIGAKDEKTYVRIAAAQSLSSIGQLAGGAVSVLIRATGDADAELRRASIAALGKIGPEAKSAVSVIKKALHDSDKFTRTEAATALGDLGPEAGEAVPDLIATLKSEDRFLVNQAKIALIKIGPPAVDKVRALLRIENLQETAALILGNMGAKAGDAVDDLIPLLRHDTTPWSQKEAARALGRMGIAAKKAIPALTDVLKNKSLGAEAAQALASIATALRDANEIGMKDELKNALRTLKDFKDDPAIEIPTLEVSRAVQFMELAFWKDLRDQTIKWIEKRPLLAIGVPLYLLWTAFWLVMLWVRPLALLRVNQLLKPLDVKLPDRLGGFKFPLRTFLMVGVLNYRPRVLDAWVKKHLPTAQERFNSKSSVHHRKVHISIPVRIDAKGMPDLKPAHLQPTFDSKVGCLLIWGEGGSGKTSLAFQVARWAMHQEGEDRLGLYPMIPVLIEHELDGEAGEGNSPLLNAVSQQLQDITDQPKPIPGDLLEHLLRYRRVLVIIDHLSEMSEHTRNCVRKELSRFPGNALLITSRLREKLDGRTRTDVKPMRIVGNRLSSFMESYLSHREKRELFSDIEFFDACRKLSSMVGKRNITVLLAKLYAEQMISAKKGVPAVDLPDSIPSLILKYLNELNRTVTENPLYDRIVHHAAKVVAWECLRKTFRPDTATYEDVLAALGDADAENHLKYLQDRLRLVQPVPPSLDRVRLILDPLAEYLAASHIVALNAGDEAAWHTLLAEADDKTGAPETISGFLLAIRDCCLAQNGELKLPDFIVPELSKRVGLAGSDGSGKPRYN